jgi:hypothetical protein
MLTGVSIVPVSNGMRPFEYFVEAQSRKLSYVYLVKRGWKRFDTSTVVPDGDEWMPTRPRQPAPIRGLR